MYVSFSPAFLATRKWLESQLSSRFPPDHLRVSAPGVPPYKSSASSHLSMNEFNGNLNSRHIPMMES